MFGRDSIFSISNSFQCDVIFKHNENEGCLGFSEHRGMVEREIQEERGNYVLEI